MSRGSRLAESVRSTTTDPRQALLCVVAVASRITRIAVTGRHEMFRIPPVEAEESDDGSRISRAG